MKNLRPFLILFLFCGAALRVLGWGEEGHRAIGAMVDRLIAGTAAARHVHDLLGEETLATASVWADVVKGRANQTEEMLQFKAANPNHSVSHYTDIPFEESNYRDGSIGATATDVVHAIPACILILQGKPEAQSIFKDVSPRVALRLLVHFVEDIHQPLHVGSGYLDKTTFVDPNAYAGHYSGDLGANRLWFGGTNGLHYYWDTTVVRADMSQAGAQTPQQYAAYLLSAPEPNWKTSGPTLEWDRAWADESLALASKVHNVIVMDEDDSQTDDRTGQPRPAWHIKDLSPEYIAWSEKTAREQMTKSGYRLAAILKAIWQDEK